MVRDLQKVAALSAGAVLGFIGLAGLFAGTQVIGLGTNATQGVLHLLTGLTGLTAAATGWSRNYNRWFGIFYLALAVADFVGFGVMADLLNRNTAVSILHFVIGAALTAVGFTWQSAGDRAVA